MAINVSVTNAEAFNSSVEDAFFDISFTNDTAFNYAADTSIYYYALLTDSTEGTAKTQEVTFVVPKTELGTIDASTVQSFAFENTESLVAPVTATGGRILYVAQ
ncbi:hypothetical protein [Clostridium sp. HBUAS56010]|uniref:hypothetical protein n=1 Tax=Clostridium sp. HBUAS56010 TaxID=2571127 RepID=UPI00117786E4|nr:hypothetical protein [Clostridium sp. HBUAS56010]